jgi:hypothetical protein
MIGTVQDCYPTETGKGGQARDIKLDIAMLGLPLLPDAAVKKIDLLFEALFNYSSFDLEGGRQASVPDRPWSGSREDCAHLPKWWQAAGLGRDA